MTAHLERELRLLEKRLTEGEEAHPEDRLALYRRFLRTATHRVHHNHRNGGDGRLVARERSQVFDVLLRHVWRGVVAERLEAGAGELPLFALVALGGYGRGELNPHSDIDVMFLHGPASQAAERNLHGLVERVLYLLWDLGLKVGHSTRTIAQAVENGNADNQSRTSLLECRLVSGDEALFGQLEKAFTEKCVNGHERDYIQWRLRDQVERHAKHGESVFMQEPNLKQGCGGLRDYHNLLWIAFFWKRLRTVEELHKEEILASMECKQIERAYDFLMRVRNELHFLSGRANDTLSLSLQGRVAGGLGYEQRPPVRRVEAFMRDYYAAAQDIYFLTNAAGRRMAAMTRAQERAWFSFLPLGQTRVEKADGFVIRDGEITYEAKTVFGEDPERLVRVYLMAQKRNLRLSFDLLRLIRRRLSMVNRRFVTARTTREMLLEILSRKGQVGVVLRAMHQTGMLGKLFPEFAPLTCLVQHEFFHRYSADEHTLVCIEQLDRLVNVENLEGAQRYQELMRRVEDPAVLHLAMLLHDTGKAESTRNHAEASANLAVRVARRLRLPPEASRTLAFLVDHHLTMSETAQRRNIDDRETIEEFARIVEDEARLDSLMLVTYADGRGTTGGAGWSDWKETLLWQLHERTRLVLAGSPEFAQKAEERYQQMLGRVVKAAGRNIEEGEAAAHFAALPRRYLQVMGEDEIAAHVEAVHDFLKQQAGDNGDPLEPVLVWRHFPERGHSSVIVVTWDRAHLVAKITGSLSLAGLNILSADIFTREDSIVVDSFCVCTDRNEAVADPRDQRAVAVALGEALAEGSEADFAERIRKARIKRRPEHWQGGDFPTRLLLDNNSLKQYTLCEITTPDRPALLHDLVTAITEDGIQIMFARILTEKGAAIDTFYLEDGQGRRVTEEAKLDGLKRRVLACTDGLAPLPPSG